MKKLNILLLVTLLACMAQAHTPLPFQAGEKLEYKLYWGIFSVGTATLEVKENIQYQGIDCHHLSFTVATNSFADAFYKVRTTITSYVDINCQRSLYYKKDQSEGSSKRDIEVAFDWKNKTATYTNFGQALPPIPIQDNTFDPLAMLFAFRTYSLDNKETQSIRTTDGKKAIQADVKIVKKETIKTKLGRQHSILVEPDIGNLGGVFKKSKNAALQIWLNQEEGQYPVQLKSKVRVGSFKAVLSKAHRPNNTVLKKY